MQQCIISLWLSSISINPLQCNNHNMPTDTHTRARTQFTITLFFLPGLNVFMDPLIDRFHITQKKSHLETHSYTDMKRKKFKSWSWWSKSVSSKTKHYNPFFFFSNWTNNLHFMGKTAEIYTVYSTTSLSHSLVDYECFGQVYTCLKHTYTRVLVYY